MVIYARMPQLHEKAYEQWEKFNGIISDAGARGYAYHPLYEFGYVDRHMLSFALGNLAWATVAILCVLMLFLSPSVALLSTVAVLSIDTLLFGMMVRQAWPPLRPHPLRPPPCAHLLAPAVLAPAFLALNRLPCVHPPVSSTHPPVSPLRLPPAPPCARLLLRPRPQVVLQVRLNSITLISLLIALALAIDYSCHLGHAFEAAPGATRREKATHALETMGASILSAGMSTLLGTLFLAISRSAVFRTFFVLVWGTILWGLVCGLAIVPAALGLFGPLNPPPAGGEPPRDPTRRPPSMNGRMHPSASAGSLATGSVHCHSQAGSTDSSPQSSFGRARSRSGQAPFSGGATMPPMAEETVSSEPGAWSTAPPSPWVHAGGRRFEPQDPLPPIAQPIRPGHPPSGYAAGSPQLPRDGAGPLRGPSPGPMRGPSPRYNSACRGALL
jgi:hypothetical protein